MGKERQLLWLPLRCILDCCCDVHFAERVKRKCTFEHFRIQVGLMIDTDVWPRAFSTADKPSTNVVMSSYRLPLQLFLPTTICMYINPLAFWWSASKTPNINCHHKLARVMTSQNWKRGAITSSAHFCWLLLSIFPFPSKQTTTSHNF